MFTWLVRRRFEKARLAAFKARPPAFLKRYLEAPFPAHDGPALTAPMLALDFETNGLDVATDSILSMGAVALADGEVEARTAWHQVLRSKADLNAEIVPIHGLTHDMVAAGAGLDEALEALFDRITGRFLLAHHSSIEAGFLMRVIEGRYDVRVPFAFLDTLLIEQRFMRHHDKVGSLRLGEVRRRYHLPDYSAHNALTDALAAAELFLAEVSHHHATAHPCDLLTYHLPR